MSSKAPLFSLRFWEMPEMTGLNRVPMRATLYPFPQAKEACGDREGSPWFRLLDGKWHFKIADRPEDLRWSDVEKIDPRSAQVDVPGNWTLQGFGRPHYTNITMPFPDEPPCVPRDNPTGTYLREFDVPAKWRGRRVVIHFGGAESVLSVYVNGKHVEIGKDSRLPSEFDITEFINFGGKNLVAAVVIKWSVP